MLKSATILSFLAVFGVSPAVLADPAVPGPETQPQLLQNTAPNAGGKFKTCLSALARLGVEGVVEQPVQSENGCRVPDPVRLLSIASGGGTISLPAKPLLNCGLALRLSTWLADVAGPVVGGFTKSSLVSVATGPGYQCRRRNNLKTGKISEHGFGNAVDISGFGFGDGKNIKISALNHGTPQQIRMLMALRISSCGYFTTVLGPGSDAAHQAHFHLDYAKRGKGWNYRICE